MKDFGTSSDPAVQAQLDRLAKLSLPEGRMGLDTVRKLLARLGDPQDRLPPVFHVAGTNGKGSVCAFLRAMLEADGKTVHVTTSPHLVRYNERIRVAGKLIEDARLAELLEEVLDAAEGLNPSFFEVTIAAAFTEFARIPADACVVEVGLGGRFDATNVLKPDVLAACGIAALGIDHERFLLAPEDGVPQEPIARIAFEKAGIAKKGVPLVVMTSQYPSEARHVIRKIANSTGAVLHEHSQSIIAEQAFFSVDGQGVRERQDDEFANIVLMGKHQILNAALARDMLQAQTKIGVGDSAFMAGVRKVRWPARMQLLAPGPLTVLADEHDIWLDGGHNPSAGHAIAEFFDEPVHLIIGMLDNKDPRALLDPLEGRVQSLQVVPVPNHDSHHATAFGPDAVARDNIEEALLNVPSDDYTILIAGSLYLAGEVLRLNDEIPD
ncbi:folylpolyglutamate synthase/dihydrofolate synthase family protein [Pontixanthobacter aestiaquae]|uniref:Bifunctional folylpolyglutamate synthase/dihydrofolate synthase n=1 Tax=Pontixanthobacter aestiaquae TaxID=1509367 RepID=A0A844ZAH5_9SPHN|nr:folylpolyglutamate synthase/dihydrofolate synthase family protein [Pontixanthobacter aestiaquae]MDN3645130.1 folylpolyglutamate synthase/dihydrofolate synthase family protein [Pontixanthobacter aestiaquae]MXO83870.1 bifunctional folylpolyglutamate synthase/dihydrofolate synthase [Pontixanthobacter aestiaquae]